MQFRILRKYRLLGLAYLMQLVCVVELGASVLRFEGG